jgi:hypothetical protein
MHSLAARWAPLSDLAWNRDTVIERKKLLASLKIDAELNPTYREAVPTLLIGIIPPLCYMTYIASWRLRNWR